MLSSIRRSIRLKFMLVVLATTFVALLVTAIVLVAYDVQSYRRTWVNDLMTQANILGRASAPALEFDDRQTAQHNLELLRVRPEISVAAIYNQKGELFATYARDDVTNPHFPQKVEPEGSRLEGRDLLVFRPIASVDEALGTVFLRSRYDLIDRLRSYLPLVAGVMIVSLAVAGLMSALLQSAVIRPILAITDVARQVKTSRDFGLRAEKTTEDEAGYLVDAFNEMLAEAGRRTEELERINKSLEREMVVREQAEEALRAADVKKDEFLATLAHELRNPLAPLSNALEILKRAEDPAMVRSAHEVMDRQLRQMVRLVDDLLDVSRITTGKLMLKRAPVTLATVVQSALDSAEPIIRRRQLDLVVSMPTEALVLNVDATRIAQVLLNLLHNAAKFTEPRGRLQLVVEREGNGIRAVVIDNGIGIPEEMLPVIFDMFAQLDHSIERSQAGLGVGLSLSRRLIELHGGTLVAHSEGLGSGSRFVVHLPEVVSIDALPVGGAAPSRAPARLRILLADDNEDFVESLGVLLESMGHEVRLTYDGCEALEAAAAFAHDLALLDIGLPRINGYDLARRIRANAARPPVLVAVTGWGQEHDKRRSREAGFDHHLVKPVTREQIVAIVALVPAPLSDIHLREA
jgi:two-component system, sensor histidine kinase